MSHLLKSAIFLDRLQAFGDKLQVLYVGLDGCVQVVIHFSSLNAKVEFGQ